MMRRDQIVLSRQYWLYNMLVHVVAVHDRPWAPRATVTVADRTGREYIVRPSDLDPYDRGA
jgi:hypothetical protein